MTRARGTCILFLLALWFYFPPDIGRRLKLRPMMTFGSAPIGPCKPGTLRPPGKPFFA